MIAPLLPARAPLLPARAPLLSARATLIFLLAVLINAPLQAQQLPIQIFRLQGNTTIFITAGEKAFTAFIYPDSLSKPVLFPIYAPDDQLITRGFPMKPRPGEPADHPHHVGLWFTYENVNGLDFWNNSYAIPKDKLHLYGWIRTTHVLKTRGSTSKDPRGLLSYMANWTDQQRNILLQETTEFYFSANSNERIIDRITTLTAKKDVVFKDAKDGLLGLRVTKELQIPSTTPGQFIDDKGNITTVAAGNSPDITGNYLTSAGKEGDSAWSTRGNWCLLYGKKTDPATGTSDTISIAIIDHPDNPGYPTYWHARGYGLFAANPLGQKIFSKGADSLQLTLKTGESATFRYRIVIASGAKRLSTGRIGELADDFGKAKD
jgi:hypothetical protein